MVNQLDFWLYMFHESNGHEDNWHDGLCEIGMANEHNVAYGRINRECIPLINEKATRKLVKHEFTRR